MATRKLITHVGNYNIEHEHGKSGAPLQVTLLSGSIFFQKPVFLAKSCRITRIHHWNQNNVVYANHASASTKNDWIIVKYLFLPETEKLTSSSKTI